MTCQNCYMIVHSHKEAPFIPAQSDLVGKDKNLYQCEICCQRWFRYSAHYHLWGRVNDGLTWKFLSHGFLANTLVGDDCILTSDYQKYAIEPAHEICREKIDKPSVILKTEGAGPAGVLQWYGEYQSGNIFNYQFHFPIVVLEKYKSNLSSFKVPFVGKIKDWPTPDQQPILAESFDDLEMNKNIAHLISSDFSSDVGNGCLLAASFAVEVISLNDPNVGVIHPRNFYDSNIIEAVDEEFRKKNPRWTLTV